MTQDYYGTKRITAWEQEKDGQPGYAVQYADGYTSWSPKAVFEEAYQPITAMSFGHAVEALKAGNRVARAGWNGNGLWLGFVTPNWSGEIKGVTLLPPDWAGYNPFLVMFTADKMLVPWLASQTDILATDWTIVS
jgi:hypothetical protein